MSELKTLHGATKSVEPEKIDALAASLRGELARPGDPGLDAARTIWNAMVDRKPGLAVRARSAHDVRQTVNFAREEGLQIAVRSGGHQIAGHAVADGALLLDLSQMRSVRVDPATKTVRVEPGATLGDVDTETQDHGLAVPMGINSTTGIAGLTLGGGFGWLSRRYGMTIDNLLSADVVTANGALLHASEDDNADLFWAIRGGGGNFGVVTSFELRLHPVGPEVLAGLIVHPFTEAKRLLRAYRDLAAEADDALAVWTVMRRAPALPFLPEEWHGKEVLVFAVCYAGPVAEGEAAIGPLRALGEPIADIVGPMPFAGWQQAFDPLLTPGARNYWKSHDFAELSDAAIDLLAGAVETLPGDECEVFVAHLGGAMARVPEDATAFPSRAAHFTMNVHTRWRDAADDGRFRDWARQLFDATAPHAIGSVYVNFMPDDETGRVSGAYGGNMARLAEIKGRYDPGNLFRLNHNIEPANVVEAAQ